LCISPFSSVRLANTGIDHNVSCITCSSHHLEIHKPSNRHIHLLKWSKYVNTRRCRRAYVHA